MKSNHPFSPSKIAASLSLMAIVACMLTCHAQTIQDIEERIATANRELSQINEQISALQDHRRSLEDLRIADRSAAVRETFNEFMRLKSERADRVDIVQAQAEYKAAQARVKEPTNEEVDDSEKLKKLEAHETRLSVAVKNDKKLLAQLQNKGNAIPESATLPPTAPTGPSASSNNLTSWTVEDLKKQQLALADVYEESLKMANGSENQRKLLLQALVISKEILLHDMDRVNVWAVRANICMMLNEAEGGREAGNNLVRLSSSANRNTATESAIAELKRRQWLGPLSNRPSKGNPFVNSLGMKFVPVPGTTVLCSIWETRVQDFAAFIKACDDCQQLDEHQEYSWKNPKFEQSPLHPVCMISWNRAVRFCNWLTEKERKAGLIGDNDTYRLPWDAEWSAMVGEDIYPWGDQWPPPKGAGNYPELENYQDGYSYTSPVGSFNPNRFGIYDLGGNVREWCMDWYRKDMNSEAFLKETNSDSYNDDGGQKYRVLRGEGWWGWSNSPGRLFTSNCRQRGSPEVGINWDGFRCVLVVGDGVR